MDCQSISLYRRMVDPISRKKDDIFDSLHVANNVCLIAAVASSFWLINLIKI